MTTARRGITSMATVAQSKIKSERVRLNAMIDTIVRLAHSDGRLEVLSFGMPASRDAKHKLKLAVDELKRELGE